MIRTDRQQAADADLHQQQAELLRQQSLYCCHGTSRSVHYLQVQSSELTAGQRCRPRPVPCLTTPVKSEAMCCLQQVH